MTEWKLVPVDPTFEMLRPWEDGDHIRFGVYVDMLAAAPKASEDHTLEQRVSDLFNAYDSETDDPVLFARAVIKVLEGNHD